MVSEDEIKAKVIKILEDGGKSITSVANSIAKTIVVDVEKRERLSQSLRNRMHHILPIMDEVEQVDGEIVQTSRGGISYKRRGKIWQLRPKGGSHNRVTKVVPETNEERKRDIWVAIRDWVNPSIHVHASTPFSSLDYPLLSQPPSLESEIYACLQEHYPSLWKERLEFLSLRSKLESEYDQIRRRRPSKKKTKLLEENSRKFEREYSNLVGHFKEQITGRHFSHLRCQ